MSDKTRFGIEVDRVARGWCNFGLCFTYDSTFLQMNMKWLEMKNVF